MNTFEAGPGLSSVDLLDYGTVVRHEVLDGHRISEERFVDAVQAIARLPVAVVAEWYGEAPLLTQDRPPQKPMFFPPDHLISGLY